MKIIAIVTMLIDHIGVVFFPDVFVLRLIGRISLMLFCFLIVEGFVHTSNVKMYMFKLGLWAAISEVPYDLLFFNTYFSIFYQNIFFTLLAGLVSLCIIDSKINSDLKVLYVVVLYTLANMCGFNSQYLGVLQIVFFYIYRTSIIKKFISTGILNILFFSRITIQGAAILAFLPIYLYNGERGRKTGDWFYAIYAGHLLLFWLVKKLFF